MVESALNLSSDDLQGDNQAVVDSLVQMQRKILHALRHVEGDQISSVNISKIVSSLGQLGWIIVSDTAPSDTSKLWWDVSEITESET